MYRELEMDQAPENSESFQKISIAFQTTYKNYFIAIGKTIQMVINQVEVEHLMY